MKQYYSPIKPYNKRKRIRIGFRVFKAVLKLFFPKNEFVWKCDKPSEDEVFLLVGNHTKLYAPLAFVLNYEKPIRPWSNAFFLFYKDVLRHMFKMVLANRKPKFLLYPLAVIISPLIVWFFRSIEPIPVYHQDRRIVETFDKAVESLESGVHQVVFPEKLEGKANEYIFELNQGFTFVAKQLYDQTGKKLKFYPVYTCQPLRKVLIGEPITYNPEINFKKQKVEICRYLENAIKELADSLPKHKIIIYE